MGALSFLGLAGPVHPDCFVGRSREVEALRELIQKAEEGSPRVCFLAGERWIGKSSLTSYVRRSAEKDGRAVACHVSLDAEDDVDSMTDRALRAIRDGVTHRWYHRAIEFVARRGKTFKVWIFSLEVHPPGSDLRLRGESFAAAVRRHRSWSPKRDRPLLLILDNVTGLTKSDRFGRWLKNTVDEVATSGRGPKLCIVLMGTEGHLREMSEHRSFDARLIQKITVGTWTDSESEQFFGGCSAARE